MVDGIEVSGSTDGFDDVLAPAALAFVADLHRRFAARRSDVLAARGRRQAEITAALAAGSLPLGFLPETADVRTGSWRVAPPAPGLVDRRCEITGPTDAKMMINALNSGARVFMADLEDATSPTWDNVVTGQRNLSAAIARTLTFANPDGREYALGETLATLVVRPRGWHLPERHLRIDGEVASGSLVDAGLHLFRNARRLVETGAGPYFYLPKMQSHLEARLWNDVFSAAEDALGLPRGTVRATVLVETLPAAFEMEEILYELREHGAGLNAGRWDYIFSTIKTLREGGSAYVLPDRAAVTMTVPFMRAYTELLVATCHRRGAHAIGGMAAFIPSRRDPEANAVALAKVREDKERESRDGFDGSWVAHPDLVPTCTDVFDAALGDRPNQLERQRPDVAVAATDLLAVGATPGAVTAEGVRGNIRVGIRYLESWLRGFGAVGIDNLMEDAATAEISRSQIWQWINAGVTLANGTAVTRDLCRSIAEAELAALLDGAPDGNRLVEAAALFEQVALGEDFTEFLTLPAYDLLP